MKTSESIDKLAPALNKAQAEMLPLTKDSANPFFKSKYADLHSVTSACYPALQANGICVIQSNRLDGSTIIVSTRLLHISCQWIETECVIPAVKADAQAYGSAYTYGRRYGLQAAVGLAPEDDDGNQATKSAAPAKKADKSPTPAPTQSWEEKHANTSWSEVPWPWKGDLMGKSLGDLAMNSEKENLSKAFAHYEAKSTDAKDCPYAAIAAKFSTALAECQPF